jgi:membrane associated rhomboid family serine protease
MAMDISSEQVGPEAARRKPIWLARVPFTLFVSAAAIGLSLAWWAGASISFVDATERILRGQYWRLITATVIHANVLHLAPNVFLFSLMGVPIECRYGPWRTALLYCVLAVGSGAAGCLAGGLGKGLSGVVSGYWGLLLVTGNAANGPKVKYPRFTTVVMLLFVTLSVLAFSRGGVHSVRTNVAHGTGLAIGLAVGCSLRAARPSKWLALVAATSMALAPATLYMPWNFAWWWHRANVFNERGEKKQALLAGRRAVELARDDETTAPLMIYMGRWAMDLKDYDEAVRWFKRAMWVTELRPTDEINLAAALCITHHEADARWLLLQVNEDDLTPQQRKSPFYSWYLNWARTPATQPSTTPETDYQPARDKADIDIIQLSAPASRSE